MQDVFHNAIPTHDLDATESYYTEVLGAKKARRYDDRVTFNFFDHQIVCHLSPEKCAQTIEIYPRHFGITFYKKEDFEKLYEKCRGHSSLLKDLTLRFEGLPEEHRFFFLKDPSNNVIEFKYYNMPVYMY